MAVLQWFRRNRSRARAVTALGVVSLVVSLAACDQSKEADKAKQAGAAPPPPAVVVAEVIQKTVPIYSEYVAQTEAKETVEIRARVQAYLAAQHFTEGTIVKKDQLLFTLDPREYEAKLLQAKAQLEGAQARLGKAETDERRLKPLAERQAVPQQDYDNAVANLETARAGVSAAKAAVVEAELDLSYCTIRSPISGLIGKRLVAPGNLVGKGEATLLDTVSSVDPIRVSVTISEAEYLRSGAAEGRADGDRRAARVGSGRRQRLPAQGQDRHHRSGCGRQDRHSHRHRRVPEPECAAAPRAVRPRARAHRDCRERHPHPQAGGSGNPGHEDRAGGGCRQHGRAAHHQARRKRRRRCWSCRTASSPASG